MNQENVIKQELQQPSSESNQSVEGNHNSTVQVNGSTITQGDGNNIDNSQNIHVTFNVGKNISIKKFFESIKKAIQHNFLDNPQEDEEYEINYVISGKAKRKDKTTLKAIEKHLRETLNVASLTIYDIDEGSIKLFFNGTQEDLEKLENAFKSGEFKDIFDIPIEDVNFVEDNKLALTISGDISYIDIAKLKSSLTGADMRETLVQKIRSNSKRIFNLAKIYLREADLSGAYLAGAYLREADLGNANFNNANLSYANLSQSYLIGANLSESYLVGANLSYANLIEATLIKADLRKANLDGAYLSDANLSYANLTDANLSNADLSDANLKGANFKNSVVTKAIFSSSNLGMSAELKQELLKKGAIFEGSEPSSLIRFFAFMILEMSIIIIGMLIIRMRFDLPLRLRQNPQICLPQYPTTVAGEEICISPPPPDLNCKDIGSPIVVQDIGDGNPDPHGLDEDNNGVGCESYPDTSSPVLNK